jgi:hypothetical protein
MNYTSFLFFGIEGDQLQTLELTFLHHQVTPLFLSCPLVNPWAVHALMATPFQSDLVH